MAATSLGPPVSGAYITWCVSMDDAAANEDTNWGIDLPDGMTVTVIGVSISSSAAPTANINVRVGITSGGNEILTNKAPTATPTFRTCDGGSAVSGRVAVAAGGTLFVTVDLDGTGAADGVQVVIYAYVTAHATNIQSD